MNGTERRNPPMPATVMRSSVDDRLWQEFVAATAVVDRVRAVARQIVANHPDPAAVGAALRILEATL